MKTVVCIMLANGRPAMVRRSIAAYHAQTYPFKRLYIFDTGETPLVEVLPYNHHHFGITYHRSPTPARTIGSLRNEANDWAANRDGAALVAHWDSDDWSHPFRLEEQVELLEHSGADLVGYREAIFWDSTVAGEAWRYRNPNPVGVIGASFLYPRATWSRAPFPDRHAGEDTLWLLNGRRFKVAAALSTHDISVDPIEPRMLCEIHGGNTSSAIERGKAEWSRQPHYDEFCRSRMAL